MENGWRRARNVLGLAVCTSIRREIDEPPKEDADSAVATPKFNGMVMAKPRIVGDPRLGGVEKGSLTETTCESWVSSPPPSSKLGLLRGNIRVSRTTCAICLEAMKPGHGHAIFTAECSHAFHFPCIASSVRHGNLICPVCRANWKEVPWQASTTVRKDDKLAERAEASGATEGQCSNSRRNTNAREQEALKNAEEEQRRLDPVLRILDESIANFRENRHASTPEPSSYDDDEPLDSNFIRPAVENMKDEVEEDLKCKGSTVRTEATSNIDENEGNSVHITLHPEAEAVAASTACKFTVLVHVTASPAATEKRDGGTSQNTEGNGNSSAPLNPSQRAPLDLVTVLDVSGSMSGIKLTLLKRAMNFVISNLSPADRLSVIVFASTAKRVFPLRRMLPEGQRAARRVIDRLSCTGGTNISEGLKKGAKVLQERRHKNPVASIMLLSDGQDTYSMSTRRAISEQRRISHNSARQTARLYPVHTFGFGIDHDAATMHAISEESGGTFSFIQAESLVQDAFAQCIGGLLSVVVQDVDLTISPLSDGVRLKSIHAGSYQSCVLDDGNLGTVKLGDLYAEEERDILVELKIPSADSDFTMNIISAKISYKDPVNSRQIIHSREQILAVSRSRDVPHPAIPPNLQVERQRNRLRTAQAIAEARALADRSKMSEAHHVLRKAKAALRSSAAIGTGDELRNALESELTEIQSRMTNKQIYERSGRAYVLSAQSSHLSQRATTRGECIDSHSREYQTPSMVDMVMRSQTLSASNVISGNNDNNTATNPNPTSAWRLADKLAKVAMLRKSSTRVTDLHGFENGGF